MGDKPYGFDNGYAEPQEVSWEYWKGLQQITQQELNMIRMYDKKTSGRQEEVVG
jgi:hypothetical protein